MTSLTAVRQPGERLAVALGGRVTWLAYGAEGHVWAACYVDGGLVNIDGDGRPYTPDPTDPSRKQYLTAEQVAVAHKCTPIESDLPILPRLADALAPKVGEANNAIARDETDEDVDSWTPIDLGPAWRGEKIKPAQQVFLRDDGLSLLPPALNYLFGDSGDGKSFVLTLATLAELQAGHPVVWVSYEDANEDLIVERLRLLDATEAQVGLLRFITPQTGLTAGADILADLAEADQARLLVLDSVGEAMAAGGINEDKDAEVGPWFRATLRRIHDRLPHLAIAPIDHSTKSRDNPLFPSGSKRKRSAPTGRAYLLNDTKPSGI